MNERKHPKFHRLAAFVLTLVMCLTLAGPAAAADDATATSVRLAKTEGTVSVTNSAGRSVSQVQNLRLFNGYHVVTEAKSYAWLNLDSAKLLKEDASSNVEVRKSGKKLEVLVRSGNLYFNVTEALDDDETLNIRTSTTLTGVRGTCGWVKVIDRWNSDVYLLEGEIQCVVTDPVSGEEKLDTISAGETATLTVIREGTSASTNGVKITKKNCVVDDVPGYILVDLVGDRPRCDDIYEDSGLDIIGELSRRGDPMAEARRRLAADEAAAAARLAAIAAQEQAQANNIDAADNTAFGGIQMVGTWGWSFDRNSGTLNIGGSGEMKDYGYAQDRPWDEYRGEIRSVVVGSGITHIGAGAFSGCTNLTNITIPDSVTSIGISAFDHCSSLTGVTIPEGVTEIEDSAFYSCTSLRSVTIPEGVTAINSAAFSHCTGLTSVTIPSSVKLIDTAAFSNCSALTDVYYDGDETQWNAIDFGDFDFNKPLTNATVNYNHVSI